MDVQCTFDGESVRLTGFIKSQEVGLFYLTMVDSDGNFVVKEINKMVNLNWTNADDALATDVTAIDSTAI